MYREIVNHEFYLGFGIPRTNTCATCDKLWLQVKTLEGHEKAKKEEDLAKHEEVRILILTIVH